MATQSKVCSLQSIQCSGLMCKIQPVHLSRWPVGLCSAKLTLISLDLYLQVDYR